MQPNSDNHQRSGLAVPGRSGTPPPTSRDAATRVMRQQIDQLYSEPQPNEQIAMADPMAMPDLPTEELEDTTTLSQPAPAMPTTAVDERMSQSSEPSTAQSNPYEQTHDHEDDREAYHADKSVNQHWAQYHSAWQQYYQQYYERYYVNQIQEHQKKTENPSGSASTVTSSRDNTLTKSEAVSELRSDLMKKVQEKTITLKKSRHFVPAMIGLSSAVLFLFLQYNPLLIAQAKAWMTPSSSLSSEAIIDPTASTQVSQDPRLIIPKINVDAPVVFDVTTLDEPVIQSKLKEGVVHYPIPGANAFPGQIGNSVIMGHSSNDVFDDGKYKFIFVQLDRLEKGDVFYTHYNGTRYTYSVTEKKVIYPTEVSELLLDNNKPMMTLITCTPIGTALKRLIVFAEQISPDPTGATEKAPQAPSEGEPTAKIGGDPRSFFERLFNSN